MIVNEGQNVYPAYTPLQTKPRKVYQAIAAVMEEIGKEGIAKDRNNAQQGYKFRGIDDVYNVLSPILAKHKLMLLPRVLKREVTERETARGGALFYVVVDVEFTLTCAEDGSAHVIRVMGEAMDSGDKATNKAMSAAYKYACMQTFCIPTEGDNDADATTHDVAAPKKGVITPPRPKAEPEPEIPPETMLDPNESAAARLELIEQINAAASRNHLLAFAKDNNILIKRLTEKDRKIVRAAYDVKQTALQALAKTEEA